MRVPLWVMFLYGVLMYIVGACSTYIKFVLPMGGK